MPYRAIVTTLVSLVIALLAAMMWVRAVQPMVNQAATQPGWNAPMTAPATWTAAGKDAADYRAPPERELRVLVKATLLLSMVLIFLLLLIGFAYSSVREWIRYRMATGRERGAGKRTRYVDAWKLAGERLQTDGPVEGGAAEGESSGGS